MRKKEAIKIIEEVLNHEFDKNKFIGFISNLLKKYEESGFKPIIKDKFVEAIKTYTVIGYYKDDEENKLSILEVTLNAGVSLERARTTQRNFVADYLKTNNKVAALVAFVSPKNKDWRLSLVKLEHSLEVVDDKLKAREEITPAKRWSFLVGENEGSHTAQSRFVDLLVSNDDPNLAELEHAFDIETVTKEFFDKYKDLFFRLKEHLDELLEKDEIIKKDFEEKEILTTDFAKKTLGQIVFLYFLQKKGWFGVAHNKEWGTGRKRFFRELFERREKYGKNFFNDILEPLFYEALSVDRGKESIYRGLNNCRIPFLDGGLFEPMNGYAWETTDILIPDEFFSNEDKTKEGDVGSGILDVFDRYNFTVNENEPLEKEVAVDPEMLGKVFENLLEIKDRKSKGAFYTPREIVHYMCQESLINYLETETNNEISREDIEFFIQKGDQIIENDKTALEKIKEKEDKGFQYKGTYELFLPASIREKAEGLDELLKNIKVADPAVGSGAFPLGIINEIVRARKVLDIFIGKNISDYQLKLHTISHSIYGVDIDPSAVEIAKLRLWLALVVEEKTPSPLPNLEYKIMQGNSLVSEYEGIKLFDESIFEKEKEIEATQATLGLDKKDSERKMERLQDKTEKYIDESQRSRKQQLKEEIDNLKWELIETTLKEQGKTDKLDEVKKLRRKNIRPFFIWKLEFSDIFKEKGGFDVVIGNPPYIMEGEDKTAFVGLHSSPCYQGKTDIWHIFTCKGISLLKQNGTISYIAKNQWLSSSSASKMRNIIYLETELKCIIDFGANLMFENADVQTMILLAQKNTDNKVHRINHKKFENQDIQKIKSSLERNDFSLNHKEIDKQFDENKNLTFSSSANEGILQKIDAKKNFEFDAKKEMIQGLIGGPDKAFIVKKEEVRTFNTKEKEYLKMLHTNTQKYSTVDTDKYIFYLSKKNFTDKDFLKCPSIRNILLGYKNQLDNRREVLKGSIKWFHLWWARDEYFFKEGAKIIFAARTQRGGFTYTDKAFYGSRNLFFIKSSRVNLKYITAVLNSDLMYFYMHERLKHTGDLLQIDKNQFLKIPLFVPRDTKPFIELIDKILEITSVENYDPKNLPIKQKEFENEIDQMVYKLYELTPEEIKIVEEQA